MTRLFALTALAVASLLAVTGCLGRKEEEVPKPKIVGFPKGNLSDGSKRDPLLVGHIAMVNEEGKFVLIRCDAWATPDTGTALKCMRNGVEVAIVNVTEERRGSYVTADIVTGSPERGDQAFQ